MIETTVMQEGECEDVEGDGGETVVVQLELRERDPERYVLESGIRQLQSREIILVCVALDERLRRRRRLRITDGAAHRRRLPRGPSRDLGLRPRPRLRVVSLSVCAPCRVCALWFCVPFRHPAIQESNASCAVWASPSLGLGGAATWRRLVLRGRRQEEEEGGEWRASGRISLLAAGTFCFCSFGVVGAQHSASSLGRDGSEEGSRSRSSKGARCVRKDEEATRRGRRCCTAFLLCAWCVSLSRCSLSSSPQHGPSKWTCASRALNGMTLCGGPRNRPGPRSSPPHHERPHPQPSFIISTMISVPLLPSSSPP